MVTKMKNLPQGLNWPLGLKIPPKLMKNINPYIQKAWWTSYRISKEMIHIQTHGKMLKKTRRKSESSKRKMTSHLEWNSNEINSWLLIRNNWDQKDEKEKSCQPRILCPVKLSQKLSWNSHFQINNIWENYLLTDSCCK